VHPFVHRLPLDAPGDVFWRAFEHWIVPQNAIAVRTAALREVGGYRDEARGAEDYDLVLRLAWGRRFVGVDRSTVRWRRHPGQQSAHQQVQHDALRRARARFVEEMNGRVDDATHARMRAYVLRDWWNTLGWIATVADRPDGAEARRRLRALAREGPGLRTLTPRERAGVSLRRQIAPVYLTSAGAPLRAAYALLRRDRPAHQSPLGVSRA
jgi:hypothetical protein